MIATSGRVVPNLLQAFDFRGSRVVADIGGGHGGLLAGVLAAHPHVNGVLFDIPAALADAHGHLAMRGVADRCRLVPGDFFSAVPSGADAYLLKFILHDWLDAECVRILQSCRTAMATQSRLLIIERLLPPRATPEDMRVVMADMQMMVTVGGQERTVADFERLLAAANLDLERTDDLSADLYLLVARPV